MNYRIDDLEFRWVQSEVRFPADDRFPEIVRWEYSETSEREFCYTLAVWVKDDEGYDLKFIGDRPFSDNVNSDMFWELAKYGQKIVNARFDLDYWNTNQN